MTSSDAILWLHRLGCSCVVLHGNRLIVCRRRGIMDLLQLLENNPETLRGSFIADKVIGKGAAALIALGSVSGVYADVISRAALSLLEESGIAAEYATLTDNIINRSGTGICPVEALCSSLSTPAECLEPIRNFINRQQIP